MTNSRSTSTAARARSGRKNDAAGRNTAGVSTRSGQSASVSGWRTPRPARTVRAPAGRAAFPWVTPPTCRWESACSVSAVNSPNSSSACAAEPTGKPLPPKRNGTSTSSTATSATSANSCKAPIRLLPKPSSTRFSAASPKRSTPPQRPAPTLLCNANHLRTISTSSWTQRGVAPVMGRYSQQPGKAATKSKTVRSLRAGSRAFCTGLCSCRFNAFCGTQNRADIVSRRSLGCLRSWKGPFQHLRHACCLKQHTTNGPGSPERVRKWQRSEILRLRARDLKYSSLNLRNYSFNDSTGAFHCHAWPSLPRVMTDGDDAPPELQDSNRLKSCRDRADGPTLHPDNQRRLVEPQVRAVCADRRARAAPVRSRRADWDAGHQAHRGRVRSRAGGQRGRGRESSGGCSRGRPVLPTGARHARCLGNQPRPPRSLGQPRP